jgi:hypothetical protein
LRAGPTIPATEYWQSLQSAIRIHFSLTG